jgi:hypothetical protein
MSFENFHAALGLDGCSGQPIYSEDNAKDLYDALKADPDAVLEQLTCTVCGLPGWQQDVSDMAHDFARDANDFPEDKLDDPDACVEWYTESHRCEYHSPFSDTWCQGWRDRERHEAEIAAIEAALESDEDEPKLRLVQS